MIDDRIKEIAARIKGLREMCDISILEMAEYQGMTASEYERYEKGEADYSFTFLYKCASKMGVDVVEIMSGESPTLSSYTVVRKNQGLEVERRANFKYRHLAHLFKNKKAEPFVVTAPYVGESEIKLSTHTAQEFDYVMSGSLKVQINGHAEILNEGDSIFYDSMLPHGMIAHGGKECVFLAVVIK